MSSEQQLAEQMKQGMRHLASGVAIVATKDTLGQPYAMTVSSITSLTASPPSLLVCVHEVAQTHAVLRDVNGFSANILSESQRDVSECCAFEPAMSRRFEVGYWRNHDKFYLPFLPDALTVFFCRISQRIDYGTHMIVIGDIQEVCFAPEEQPPLVYCRGEYHKLLKP